VNAAMHGASHVVGVPKGGQGRCIAPTCVV
jgi:hypothetical protein